MVRFNDKLDCSSAIKQTDFVTSMFSLLYLEMFRIFYFIVFRVAFGSFTPNSVVPTKYQIDVVRLETDVITKTGIVSNIITIDVRVVHPEPKDITVDLNDECSVDSVSISVRNRSLNAEYLSQFESIVILIPDSAKEQIQTGDTFKLTIAHKCPVKYADFGKGLYFEENDGTHERVIATKFEAIQARRMFPCFDSPKFKTPFIIRVAKRILRQGESAYSNGRQKLANAADEFIEFEQTIPLPTYLVALAIGKFERANRTTESGIDIGVVHSPTYHNLSEETVANALSMMELSLDYMQQFTGIKYEYSKLDMIVVPLLAWGMENYGLITMKKEAMESNSTIAHEVAHMWFGDSVTPTKWDDIWLNEGFANFFNNKIVPNSEKCRESGLAAERENPISVRFPYSEYPHTDLFQNRNNTAWIIYPKGCAILQMLEPLLGEQNFKTAIRRYVKQFANANVNSFQFMDICESTAKDLRIKAFRDIDPVAFLWNFIRNRGYPKVYVEYTNDGKAVLSQKPSIKGSDQHWHIPIWFSFQKNLKGPFWLTPGSSLILGPKEGIPQDANQLSQVIWNPNGFGYYQTIVDGKAEEILVSEQQEAKFFPH